MKSIAYTNLAIFALFFGLALVEALQQKQWLKGALFAALGLLSLRADFKK